MLNVAPKVQHCHKASALFNLETSILIQKSHPYTGNLNTETSGDSENTFLHCGDVSALVTALALALLQPACMPACSHGGKPC